MEKPKLHTIHPGWLYYGEVRLNCRMTKDGLEFRVKEGWLRPEYGETVTIPLEDFVKLAETPSQAPHSMLR